MKLGENIYSYRTAKQFTQGDLADALDVSRQSVSKWENGSAVPELDKLIKMSRLFGITLDELVYASPAEVPPKAAAERVGHSVRTTVCLMTLFVGMIFFLLSVFWGDHLRFGEEFGELVSLIIILFSTAFLATDNTPVLASCALLYFLYSVICFGILDVDDLLNSFFIFVAGMVILVWFIVWGYHATDEHRTKTL